MQFQVLFCHHLKRLIDVIINLAKDAFLISIKVFLTFILQLLSLRQNLWKTLFVDPK